jgi:signal transduction histidine kinase
MESYLQRFLTLGQNRDVPHEPLELEKLVEDALDLVRPRTVHANIDLIYNKFCESVHISGDADALRQLFVNLLINAIEAVSGYECGVKKIEVELNLSKNNTALVKISDTGPGPAPEVAERLFEPFVTAKPEGTGLGLYVARQTVEIHQGIIHWQHANGMTCFMVEFPITVN